MKYRDSNDYELLYLIEDGSDEYAKELFKKYEGLIINKCIKWNSLLKKLDLEMDDMEQEVRISFLQAIRGYQEEGDATFYTYVNSFIDKRLCNLVRSTQSLKNRLFKESISLYSSITEDDQFLIDSLSFNNESVETIVETREIEGAIEEFLMELTLSNAMLLELYLGGYSYKSISLLTERSLSSTTSQIVRLRKKLSNYLVEKELVVL